MYIVENRSYSTVEIEIREFLVTNTFAYAYVSWKRYVFNSIGKKVLTFGMSLYIFYI